MVVRIKDLEFDVSIMTGRSREIRDLIERITNIEEDQLDEEMRVFPSVYTYFQGLATEVSMQAEEVKDEQKRWFARFLLRRYKELQDLGIKPSFTQVEREIQSLDVYYEQERKIRERQHCYYRLLHIVKALEAKKDLLIQLSANKRNELKLNL